MKIMFFIPPAEHRGWPGTADVHVESERGKTVVCIEPYAASGAINGGCHHRYILQLSPWQLFKLALAALVALVRSWKGLSHD